MNEIYIYIALGLLAGVLSGLLGLGGGIILIPALIFFFGLSQHEAQGTTLAMMVPPVGILAAYSYYKQGHVDIQMAIFLCIGFFLGGFFGAKIANFISDMLLHKIFGICLFLISIKMIFFSK